MTLLVFAGPAATSVEFRDPHRGKLDRFQKLLWRQLHKSDKNNTLSVNLDERVHYSGEGCESQPR